MGLLKAEIGALQGVLADQWREYFHCDAMDETVLMVKGENELLPNEVPMQKAKIIFFQTDL